MAHSIIIRPRRDFEPTADGIYVHAIRVADDTEIVTESTEYLRAMARVCNEKADRIEALA